jgi:hypothetical protein
MYFALPLELVILMNSEMIVDKVEKCTRNLI